MAVLSTAAGALERARRAYERAARESERALDAFKRADADFNLRSIFFIYYRAIKDTSGFN